MGLIQYGEFVSHSGLPLSWKVDCDALTDDDLEAVAAIVGRKFLFGQVYGIPRGGTRLANALRRFSRSEDYPTLIVDDVLTTGASFREARARFGDDVMGFVIVARGRCPDWIWPMFEVKGWVR